MTRYLLKTTLYRNTLHLLILVLSLFSCGLKAQAPYEPFAWVPYPSQRLRTPAGACVFNNLLWEWQYGDYNLLLTAFDGKQTVYGGKVVGSAIRTLHPTGAGLYATVSAQRTTVQVKNIKGAFIVAEPVTQPSTGATGFLVIKKAKVFVLIGTFHNFNATPIVGTKSGAILTPESVVNEPSTFLERSLTGFDDFVPVMDIPYHLKMRGLVDCGRIKFADKTKRLLLAFDDPIIDGQFAHVYYNFPEIDNNWQQLMVTQLPNGERPIRHFHGAIWIPGANEGQGRLIAMTGDYDTEASLLVCDDVADFINHPGNWKTNWGLDRTGADRVNYLQNKGKPYCIGTGSQLYRIIDILLDPNGKDAYYIPDTNTLTYLMKIDLPNKTAKQIGQIPAKGFGWMALRLSNGQMLFSTASEFRNGKYAGNCDPYVRVYSLTPDGSDITEVFATIRADYQAPVQARSNIISIVEYNNTLWMPTINVLDPISVGWIGDKSLADQVQKDEAKRLKTVLNNLTTKDFLQGNGRFTATNVSRWAVTRGTISSDSKVTNPNISPSQPSLSCLPSPTETGTSAVRLNIDSSLLTSLAGQWITLVTTVHTEKANETVGATLTINGATSNTQTITTTGKWDDLWVTIFVPTDATAVTVDLLPRTDGDLKRKVWFSNAYLLRGALPR